MRDVCHWVKFSRQKWSPCSPFDGFVLSEVKTVCEHHTYPLLLLFGPLLGITRSSFIMSCSSLGTCAQETACLTLGSSTQPASRWVCQGFLVSCWLLGKKPCFEVPRCLPSMYLGVLRDRQEAPHTALLAPLASNVASTRGVWGS